MAKTTYANLFIINTMPFQKADGVCVCVCMCMKGECEGTTYIHSCTISCRYIPASGYKNGSVTKIAAFSIKEKFNFYKWQ